ncbi:beta-ketoacyl-ACP synthase [Acinetobacter qingfengensis]|uniref:Beta-ketoacyl-[acyl-carrier-protein] synthase II n=1 Tax=Acinetobacter qingfengensis TaxID=1262585 RepID=A0A1E7R2T0_9GAMM|nr:beta-ketoacyl-ACP synthase [Acinetobacter qingfengensis]KAA8733861.1 beta-ketoacyl-ACP synthase [Acinetobacter qingfengensis]OEY93626.1 beta-ketoacyl-[acyl-carrier-protein] synthase II [Acinetobacter qingfengensis]
MQAVGIQCSTALSALNQSLHLPLSHWLCGDENPLTLRSDFLSKPVWVGAYPHPLTVQIPQTMQHYASRNLQFALEALHPMMTPLQQITAGVAKHRLAIILGTSTSGIADNQQLLEQQWSAQQAIQLDYARQGMSALAQGLQQYLGWYGVAYSISTACSSSAKALAAGQRLLNSDLADVVLVGGVDTLCKLTLQGFNSLDSLSAQVCQPCGAQRDGINIGEAAALFVLTRDRAPVLLCGAGESMDAWHISAPHPQGQGAEQAMQAALTAAQLEPSQIDYVNLHGTATIQNDAMEAKAISRVFSHAVWVSSTKHKTGHCLGAAGAIEAYICQQILQDTQSWLPWHHQSELDMALAHLNYVQPQSQIQPVHYAMSNSFAFGGSNISLIFARGM